jgi:SAM-dependent methyltransferase
MKTRTDAHWNDRALSVEADVEVNIMDVFQRELEYDAICGYLARDMKVLEVGCGNGFSTRRFREVAGFVDAFDLAENMIERAKRVVGEENNRFFEDNVLEPTSFDGPYDAVVCVRVLINLANLDQQRQALSNMTDATRRGGLLILAEGFTDGFDELNRLRAAVGISPLQPAEINFYSAVGDLEPEWQPHFELEATFHLGAYDYLTRVVYPQVAGETNVRHNTNFSERCSELARAFNPDCFAPFSRMRGFVLRKRET